MPMAAAESTHPGVTAESATRLTQISTQSAEFSASPSTETAVQIGDAVMRPF